VGPLFGRTCWGCLNPPLCIWFNYVLVLLLRNFINAHELFCHRILRHVGPAIIASWSCRSGSISSWTAATTQRRDAVMMRRVVAERPLSSYYTASYKPTEYRHTTADLHVATLHVEHRSRQRAHRFSAAFNISSVVVGSAGLWNYSGARQPVAQQRAEQHTASWVVCNAAACI